MKFTITIIIIIIRYPGISSFGIPYTVNFSQYPVSPPFLVHSNISPYTYGFGLTREWSENVF